MDKDSMDTNPTEYSKSGGDPESAQLNTAFDPSTTRSEEQGESAARESVSCAYFLLWRFEQMGMTGSGVEAEGKIKKRNFGN